MSCVDLDLNGMLDDLARLMTEERIEIDPDFVRNDMSDHTCRDDVWTPLVHLGYLSYGEEVDSYGDEDDASIAEYARIPNDEVRAALENVLERLTPDRLWFAGSEHEMRAEEMPSPHWPMARGSALRYVLCK